MPPADRTAWLTEKIERYPPRKVVPPPWVLYVERVGRARAEIGYELTKRARIDERTEELLGEIEWPAHAQLLPQLVTRFLDRHHKEDWRSPMKASGAKEAKRLLACVAEDKLVASIYPTAIRRLGRSRSPSPATITSCPRAEARKISNT